MTNETNNKACELNNQIIDAENEIRIQIMKNSPLVGEKQHLDKLLEEQQNVDNPIQLYINKIKWTLESGMKY